MPKKKACSACKGRGRDFETNCPDCAGSGNDPSEDNPRGQCHTCFGEGTVQVEECNACDGTGFAGGV